MGVLCSNFMQAGQLNHCKALVLLLANPSMLMDLRVRNLQPHICKARCYNERLLAPCLQVYGYQSIKTGQSSEQLIGRFVKAASEAPQPLIVGTKFFTVPWTNVLVGGGLRLGRQSMISAVKASMKRMDRQQIDLWQVSPGSLIALHTVLHMVFLLDNNS